MPESREESFCVINTKSLGVPCCLGLRCGYRMLIGGRGHWKEISLRQHNNLTQGKTRITVKVLTSWQMSWITLLITNSVWSPRPLQTPTAQIVSPLLHVCARPLIKQVYLMDETLRRETSNHSRLLLKMPEKLESLNRPCAHSLAVARPPYISVNSFIILIVSMPR